MPMTPVAMGSNGIPSGCGFVAPRQPAPPGPLQADLSRSPVAWPPMHLWMVAQAAANGNHCGTAMPGQPQPGPQLQATATGNRIANVPLLPGPQLINAAATASTNHIANAPLQPGPQLTTAVASAAHPLQ